MMEICWKEIGGSHNAKYSNEVSYNSYMVDHENLLLFITRK